MLLTRKKSFFGLVKRSNLELFCFELKLLFALWTYPIVTLNYLYGGFKLKSVI